MVYSFAGTIIQGVYVEVDSTESVWYKRTEPRPHHLVILKLTPQSQYGIEQVDAAKENPLF